MATRASRKKIKAAQHAGSEYRHPLRIVPLHTAPRIASTTPPELTYRNGPLLTKVRPLRTASIQLLYVNGSPAGS